MSAARELIVEPKGDRLLVRQRVSPDDRFGPVLDLSGFEAVDLGLRLISAATPAAASEVLPELLAHLSATGPEALREAAREPGGVPAPPARPHRSPDRGSAS